MRRPEAIVVGRKGALAPAIRGTEERPCVECGEACWVAPSSVTLARLHRLPFLCHVCAGRQAIQVELPTREQVEELEWARNQRRRDLT